jgi:predicted metal-dependent HD superfamily phosphohydrolase
MPDLNYLTRRWNSLMGGLKVSPTGSVLDDLIQRYSEPQRAYHNLKHIEALLRLLPQEPELELAAWFHDAIYDPQHHDNEEQSAALAEQQLGPLGIDIALIERVSELIQATKTHEASDATVALFIDADLSILGTEPETYARYARAIRQEYSWVAEADYRAGRSKVLQRFLDRERIYQTDMFEQLEARARENMEGELSSFE